MKNTDHLINHSPNKAAFFTCVTALTLGFFVCLSGVSSPAVGLEVAGDGKDDNGPEDGRMPLTSLETGFLKQIRAVGVIRCSGAVVGTATIIHQKDKTAQVITAGHVPFGKKDCLFYPYDMYQGYALSALSYGAKYAGKGAEKTEETATERKIHQGDYALFKVAADLSAFGSIPLLGTRIKGRPRDPFLLIGYHLQYNTLAASIIDCHLVKKTKDGLASDQDGIGLDQCDSGPGASGGPMLRIDRMGILAFAGLRTGRLFAPTDQDDKLKAGDAADGIRFANVHHRLSAELRDHIKRHRANHFTD